MLPLIVSIDSAAVEYALQQTGDVPSPCISVCSMGPDSGLCQGCFRTIDEIVAWSRLDADGKRAVWRLIGQRIDATFS
ncbi:MAG: DUF1289 domain-containing protein [Burkholderiaceae bacterium]